MKTRRILVLLFCTLAISRSLFASPADAISPSSEMKWRMNYDKNGHLEKLTDPAGRSTTFMWSYDENNRPRTISKTSADGSNVTVEFNERRQRTLMTDGYGTVQYLYDNLGRLSNVQRNGVEPIAYSYDTLNRIASLKVGTFYKVKYTYDFLGRLESIDTPVGPIRYKYLTEQGEVIRTLPNGAKTIWDFEANGKLNRITLGWSRNPNDTRYSVLEKYDYHYRSDGRIASIQEISDSGQTVKIYKYDLLGRLLQASGPSGQFSFGYDPSGNRTNVASSANPEQVCTYDWAGRLRSLNGTACDCDGVGNLLTTGTNAAVVHYAYDGDNQLQSVNNGEVSYQYDGMGRLLRRKSERSSTSFIPDPTSSIWRPLVIESDAGERTLVIWDGNDPVILIRNANPKYLLSDHLGSVRLVLDSEGKESQKFDYDPFGVITAGTQSADFAPRFAGLFWDSEARAYLTGARAYAAELGRFLQADRQQRLPSGLPRDMSFYNYCGSDPVNCRDRNGFSPESVISAKQFDSFSPLWESLDEVNHDMSIDVSLDLLSFAPGKVGEAAESLHGAYDYYNLGRDVLDTASYFQTQPGDPASMWKGTSLGLELFSLTGPGELLPGVAGGLVQVGDMAYKIGESARSQVLQNRALSLVALGEKISKSASEIRQEMESHYGDFSMRGNLFSASGGWNLTHSRDSIFSQSSHSMAWANTQVEGLTTANGSYITGTFRRAQRTDEEGRRVFNVFEPTSTSTTTYSHDSYNISFNGSSWNQPGSEGGRLVQGDSPLIPSSVGGIYLGGAGAVLNGLGKLRGMKLDSNGSLILVGKGGREVALPPVRLDDIVTIFRSVYLYGEGPTVTIDPDAKDPKGPTMLIRHGKGTEDTYVGWVLYHADRLMKGYTLGVDNITGKEVQGTVHGHAEVLDAIYFGGENLDSTQKNGHWERFWIVPCDEWRVDAPAKELTLIDFPLKVKTQPMKWQNGELVADPQAQPSPGAKAFTNWFTSNYDSIARERMLPPPPESGLTEPVPVFAELHRFNLLTAIAEKLRDDGVPLPFWMRDYSVQRVNIERSTPSLTVFRTNQLVVADIYGGVDSSPPDKIVNEVVTAPDLDKLAAPGAIRALFDESRVLEPLLLQKSPSAEPLDVEKITKDGVEYRYTTIPGADTQVLAPCRLTEADLTVFLEGGHKIQVVRSFNSFFDPDGPWGKGWALDLPFLQEASLPVGHDVNSVQMKTIYELLSPLNTAYARFSKIAEIPALNGNRLQVPDQPCCYFGIVDATADFLTSQTSELIRKDGGSLHFTKNGYLAATDQDGFRTVYERDAAGRVASIIGLLGRTIKASIDFRYNSQGRLEEIRSSGSAVAAEVAVRYEYDSSGRLASAESDSQHLDYKYSGSLVTSITSRSKQPGAQQFGKAIVRRFEYRDRGRLLAEVDAKGNRIEYRSSNDGSGISIATSEPGSNPKSESIRYDSKLRPFEAVYGNGTKELWHYAESGGLDIDITDPGGTAVQFSESADKCHRTLKGDNQSIVGEYDPAGRLTSLSENGQVLFRQQWQPDGRLQSVGNDYQVLRKEYDENGLVSAVLLAPPEESGTFNHFQKRILDPGGRPLEITDNSQLKLDMNYNDTGQLMGAVSERDGKNYGFKILRGADGQVEAVESSWSKQNYRYTDYGALSELSINQSGDVATVRFAPLAPSGRVAKVSRPVEIRDFDGGVWKIAYTDADIQGEVKQVQCPNNDTIDYTYDSAKKRLSEVHCTKYTVKYDRDPDGRLKAVTYHDGLDAPSKVQTSTLSKVNTSNFSAETPDWNTRLLELYPQLVRVQTPSSVEQMAAAKQQADLVGQQLGPYQIKAVYRSYTPVRVLEVAGPDGISIIKIQPRNDKSIKEANLNDELSRQLSQKGFSVARPLTVEGEHSQQFLITRETKVPGEIMEDHPLTQAQQDNYAKLAFKLFHEGTIEPAFEAKPAITTANAMRDKLNQRNDKARTYSAVFDLTELQSARLNDAKLPEGAFHDGFKSLLSAVFKGDGEFLTKGLVHDNNPKNFYIDGDNYWTFDFGGDYIGNIGNVFSEVVRTVFWKGDGQHEYVNFKEYFDRLVWQYSEATGQNLSEDAITETLRCMMMTPYIHSSSDSKMLLNELASELALPADVSDEQLLKELAKPENRVLVEIKLQQFEKSYLQNMKQLRLTLKLLLEHSKDQAEKREIETFIPVLDAIVRTGLRMVMDVGDTPVSAGLV